MNIFERALFFLRGKVIHTKTSVDPKKGAVLLSYTTLPFRYPKEIFSHTNRWECAEIVRILNSKGYDVDIIDYTNTSFIPKKPYAAVIDLGENLERLTKRLPKKTLKIFHITGAHYAFQNTAEQRRLDDIYKKRGVHLKPRRTASKNNGIEICDVATMLGNDFTKSTYAFARKTIYRLPISTTHIFSFPSDRSIDRAKHNFIWLGGSGMTHKGLDLALEAFVGMPDKNLYIFGKMDDDFGKLYEKELFKTNNIHYEGFVDIGSEKFRQIATQCIGLVFPSCSEGSSGSVVSCMHAGLIPIVSYESGVNVGPSGTILEENTVTEIQKQVLYISNLDNETLLKKTKAIWTLARETYTREAFSKAYEDFVDKVL